MNHAIPCHALTKFELIFIPPLLKRFGLCVRRCMCMCIVYVYV